MDSWIPLSRTILWNDHGMKFPKSALFWICLNRFYLIKCKYFEACWFQFTNASNKREIQIWKGKITKMFVHWEAIVSTSSSISLASLPDESIYMCFLDRVFVRLGAARDEKERNMNVLMSRPSNCEGETNNQTISIIPKNGWFGWF